MQNDQNSAQENVKCNYLYWLHNDTLVANNSLNGHSSKAWIIDRGLSYLLLIKTFLLRRKENSCYRWSIENATKTSVLLTDFMTDWIYEMWNVVKSSLNNPCFLNWSCREVKCCVLGHWILQISCKSKALRLISKKTIIITCNHVFVLNIIYIV